MDIKDALEYIHHVKWHGSKPGLSRTRELLRYLGNPEDKLNFVHVAGTNGKGSTCACIASILHEAGYKTGLYTSPYIMRFNERIQIGGAQISDAELTALVEELGPVADAMEDSPTEFEMITALAMTYFLRCGCDIVVMEVGMGGELDSTNVIKTPDLAVITAIDYDHVAELGPELRDIARAKAGIIKSGGDVLIYGENSEVEDVLCAVAAERGARIHKADFSRLSKIDVSKAGTSLVVEPYRKRISLPLAGLYQPYNALVAITAAELLREKGYSISDDNIAGGIAAVRWPGRFEFLGYDPVFILDGAHNRHGVKAAVDSLLTYFGRRRFIFIMGVLADKDVQAMIELIAPAAEMVFTTRPDNPRAMDASKLADMFIARDIPAAACNCVGDAVRQAFEKARGGGGIICTVGSLYLSADIKRAYDSKYLTI